MTPEEIQKARDLIDQIKAQKSYDTATNEDVKQPVTPYQPWYIPRDWKTYNPDVKIWDVPMGEDRWGAVVDHPDVDTNKEMGKNIYLNKGVLESDEVRNPRVTLRHETEHHKNKELLGHTNYVNYEFDRLVGDPSARYQIAKDISKLKPYLMQKYGLNSRDLYLDPSYEAVLMQENAGKKGRERPGDYFHEQIATLSALEQESGKRLMDDPEIRKIFNTPAKREAFDAVTGRRLYTSRSDTGDRWDIPPYTRIKEEPRAISPNEGWVSPKQTQSVEEKVQFMPFLDKIKAKLGIK